MQKYANYRLKMRLEVRIKRLPSKDNQSYEDTTNITFRIFV